MKDLPQTTEMKREHMDNQQKQQTPIFVRESNIRHFPIEFVIAGRLLDVSIEKAKIIYKQLGETLRKYKAN